MDVQQAQFTFDAANLISPFSTSTPTSGGVMSSLSGNQRTAGGLGGDEMFQHTPTTDEEFDRILEQMGCDLFDQTSDFLGDRKSVV